jgi:hypothetical protein
MMMLMMLMMVDGYRHVCSYPRRLYSSMKQPETRHVQSFVAVLPTPCSSPYATIPFFNTAKTTVPRLATIQSFEWVLFAMVDGKYEHLLRYVGSRRSEDPSPLSFTSTPLTLPNCLQCGCFILSQNR